MHYTIAQVQGYLQASAHLEGEALYRQALAARAAQQDDDAWREWTRKLLR